MSSITIDLPTDLGLLYYGATYTDKGRDGQDHQIILQSHRPVLDILLRARRDYAYGIQHDYFDHPNTVGWTRLGNDKHPESMAVIMGNGSTGTKWMNVGKPDTTYTDITKATATPVVTNSDGWGNFACQGGSVSVWVPVS